MIAVVSGTVDAPPEKGIEKDVQELRQQLAKVLENQATQTTLDALNADTRIVYHYFLWAGT